MTFPHRDDQFDAILRIVAEKHGLSVGIVEKDYWVTHLLWGLHASGFDIWFKGGTSLSKGFGLINRFSEDLDLLIEPGSVAGLSLPENWSSGSSGQIKKRRVYFEQLSAKLGIPDMTVRLAWVGKDGRAAECEVYYPGKHTDDLRRDGMRPFVLIEAGRARVSPFVAREMSSFVHDFLEEGGFADMLSNRPAGVRCVHPLVTLLDKLDAISKRHATATTAVQYVRHYEDAARIIERVSDLPSLVQSPAQLAAEMVQTGDLRAIPRADDPAFYPQGGQAVALEEAHTRIAGMFWAERDSFTTCCRVIRGWIAKNLE